MESRRSEQKNIFHSNTTNSNSNKVNVGRSRLTRKCNQIIPQISSDNSKDSTTSLSEKVTCLECGYLAKNDKGLKIHANTHKKKGLCY